MRVSAPTLQEWIHPGTVLRRLSMIGRASAQPHNGSTQKQPRSEAPAGVTEEPDLELGLLPHANTDSASVLHSSAPDKGATQADR